MRLRSTISSPSFAVFSLFLAFGSALAACQHPIDTTRQSAYTGTLGEEIHEIFCLRFASEAYPNDVSGSLSRALCAGTEAPTASTPAPLRALVEERPRLVTALDATFAEETHAELDSLLVEILPLYDEGVLPGQTRSLADLLETLAADEASVNALARFSHRRGYRPMSLGLGVLRPMLLDEGFPAVTRESLAALGRGGAVEQPFLNLLRAAAYETATLEPSDDSDEPSTLALTRDLMFREDAAFASGTPQYAVRRDIRGIALPTGVNGTVVPAPFRDTNNDKLPDVDDLGRFVGSDGTPLDLPTPFPVEGEGDDVPRDAAGRATKQGGGYVYQYVDIDRTMAAGFLREATTYFAPTAPTLIDMMRAMPVALGGDEEATETYGEAELTYPGFALGDAPLLDLVHALEPLAHRQETVDGMVLVETLLGSHEAATSNLVEAMLYADTRAAATPNARLEQPNIFWDDLLEVLERLAKIPDMLERVLRAVDNDQTQDLDEVVAAFARNRDAVTFNSANVNQPIPAGPLTDPVQRNAADTPTNESLLQRSLHLIHDLNGARYCNKQGAEFRLYYTLFGNPQSIRVAGPYDECEFIRIDNVAKSYTQAMQGRFELTFGDAFLSTLLDIADLIGLGGTVDDLLENQSGIEGLTRFPTPEAMSRLVFAPRNDFLKSIFDDLRAADGVPIEDRHCIGRTAGNRTTPCPNAVIFAWEKPITLADGHTRTFLDALRPALLVLDDLEPAEITYFGQISSAIHRHYASRSATRTQRANAMNPGFSYQDNARSYEPLLADIFDGGRFMHRLRAVVQAADGIQVRAGVDGVDTLAVLGEILMDPAKSCTGDCATTSLRTRDNLNYICFNDGRCMNGQGGRPRRYPSPMYLLLDALSNMDDAWVSDETRHDSWLKARGRLVDQFFRTEVVGGNRRFRNRRGFAILRTALPFLRERIVDHRTDGSAAARTWAMGLTEDLQDFMENPLLAGLVRLLDGMDQDPEARDALLAVLDRLVDEPTNPEAFDALVLALTDALYLLEDEESLIPLLNTVSVAFAPNVAASIENGAAVDVESSVAYLTVDLLRRIAESDDTSVIPRVLAHGASFPASGDPITRLETILDVLAEVNRTTPREGGAVDQDDVRAIFAAVQNFLTNEERGLERLYDVIENRTLVP